MVIAFRNGNSFTSGGVLLPYKESDLKNEETLMTESPASPERVQWGISIPAPTPEIYKSIQSIKECGIDWGGGAVGPSPDLEALIGLEDAFEHTPLLPGEQIAFCKRDKVAYHIDTWEFLKQQNQGRCCICGQSDKVTFYTLPERVVENVSSEPVTIPPFLRPGEKIISLNEIQEHVNHAVIIQGLVNEVYSTRSTGTYFVRFEPRERGDAPYKGFKVVIFPSYQPSWLAAGIAISGYRGHEICVRGLIQVHDKWGIEILVNSPRVLQIIK